MNTGEETTNTEITETMFSGVCSTHGWTGYTKKAFPEVENPLELLMKYRNHSGFKRLCADMGLMFNTHSKSIAVNFADSIVLVTQNDDDTTTCVRDGVELSTQSKFDLTVASEKLATLLDVEASIVSVITTLDRVKKTMEQIRNGL